MNAKNRFIKTTAIIGALVILVLTALPGCNFIGQSKNGGVSDSGALVDDSGNELCCPVCKSIDISGPDADGYYICNSCGQKWQYDNTQINAVDASGNVSTMDASAGYVSGGSSGNSGNGSSNGGSYDNNGGNNNSGYNGGSGNSGTNGNGNSNSGSGNSSGNNNYTSPVNPTNPVSPTKNNNTTTKKNNNNSSYTTKANTPADVRTNLENLKKAADSLGNAVNITYNPKTGEYSVINKEGVDTGLFGYKYSDKDKIFFTAEDSWQRNFGFTETYDKAAAIGFMSYNTFRVYYTHSNLEWMIQFWKGQYGYAFIGSEIGVYTRPIGSDNGTYYDCADDDHKFYMTMDVYRQNVDNPNKYDHLFTRSRCKTWWCTGFVPGTLGFAQINVPDENGTATLKVDSRIEFFDEEMAQGFINGVKQVKYLENNAALAGTKRAVTFAECANEAEYEKCVSSNKICLCKNKQDGKYRDVRICYR